MDMSGAVLLPPSLLQLYTCVTLVLIVTAAREGAQVYTTGNSMIYTTKPERPFIDQSSSRSLNTKPLPAATTSKRGEVTTGRRERPDHRRKNTRAGISKRTQNNQAVNQETKAALYTSTRFLLSVTSEATHITTNLQKDLQSRADEVTGIHNVTKPLPIVPGASVDTNIYHNDSVSQAPIQNNTSRSDRNPSGRDSDKLNWRRGRHDDPVVPLDAISVTSIVAPLTALLISAVIAIGICVTKHVAERRVRNIYYVINMFNLEVDRHWTMGDSSRCEMGMFGAEDI